jgi:hypothetical protein
LDFVNYNLSGIRPGGKQFTQSLWACGHRSHSLGIQQVNPEGIRKEPLRQPGFSRTARAEEKKVVIGRREISWH